MNERKARTSWWKLSEGKFVANQFGAKLDTPTQALVRDLIETEAIQKALEQKSADEALALRLVETPLPFEELEEWITWTVRGSDMNQ